MGCLRRGLLRLPELLVFWRVAWRILTMLLLANGQTR